MKAASQPPGDVALTEPGACSLFEHLPLDAMHLDQDNVIFEDEAHYHTIVSSSEEPRFRIASTRKAHTEGARSIFMRIGQQCGVMAISKEEIAFTFDEASSRKMSVSCPKALSRLLQSGVHLDHAVANVSSQLATMYIFYLSAKPQVWRIEIYFDQNSIQTQQLELKQQRDPPIQHTQHDTVKNINKRLSRVGTIDELCLSFTCGKEMKQIRMLLGEEEFTIHDGRSTPLISTALTQVASNGSTKIATRESPPS